MTPNKDRQRQVEQLFARNYNTIREFAENPNILVNDIDNIINGLASHLVEYAGPIQDEPFLEWTGSVIRPAVVRVSRFYELCNLYEKSVLEGIWTVLRDSKDLSEFDDPAHTAREIAATVWVWVFEHLDELDRPGTAKLSTRLHAKAYWTARSWKTDRLRERVRTSDVDTSLIGRDTNGVLIESPRIDPA